MATHDELVRVDETQKRLLDWTYQQAPSERLAAQILDAEGYKDIDALTHLAAQTVVAMASAPETARRCLGGVLPGGANRR